jgi:2'-5' RNA ligase
MRILTAKTSVATWKNNFFLFHSRNHSGINKLRAFIAVAASRDIRDYLTKLQELLISDTVDLKFPKEFHITLKFLGEINDSVHVIERLNKISFSAFELELSNIGFFPSERKINVIWAGVKENSALIELYNKINNSIAGKNDFDFKPHFTLARVKDISELPKYLEQINKIKVIPMISKVDRFILYKSTLTPSGPVYEVLREFHSIL